jgi:hypothetical protein
MPARDQLSGQIDQYCPDRHFITLCRPLCLS